MQCEIRETLSGYGILLQFGNRDSPKFAHACGIGKEKDIQDGGDGSSGCEIPEKRERECPDLPLQTLLAIRNKGNQVGLFILFD